MEKIGNKVDQNKESIYELEKSVKRINEEKEKPAVHTSLKIQTKGERLSIEDVMIGQARFSTAIQLGNSPTMLFIGELSTCTIHNYVLQLV